MFNAQYNVEFPPKNTKRKFKFALLIIQKIIIFACYTMQNVKIVWLFILAW